MTNPNTQSIQASSASPTLVDRQTPVGINESGSHVDTNEPEEEVNPFSAKKRQKTSKVWDDFKEVTLPHGTMKAECIHCKKKLALNKSGATTHFIRHLKGCTLKKIAEKGQQHISITTSLAESETVSAVQNFKYDQAKMREVISHMIIVHELPFSFVEYKLFNLTMRTATPHYQSISRATAKKDCMTSYEMEKKKVIAALNNVNRVSVTTDLWKSDQKISYMVVTCHFVDPNYHLQKRVLNFCDVPPPHTGLSISDALYKCLVEWGIENKVWTVTVDNAAYNDAAVRSLKGSLAYCNTLPIGGKLFHVRCCAHILNLLVQDGVSEINVVITKVRESVKYITASESRINLFSEIAKQLHLSSKKLVLDCCMRWNATYFMLIAALEFKDVFPRYKERDISYDNLPSEEEWEKVEVVCSFLEEFSDVTELISGSEYPTANLFLTMLYNIKKVLNEAVEKEGFMVEMVRKMNTKFDKYWGECNLLISMAAVLDPRYKMELVEWCFPEIYPPASVIENIALVLDTLRKLYDEYFEAHKAMVEKDAQVETENCSNTVGNVIGRGKESKAAQFKKHINTVEPAKKRVKSELETYLEDGVFYLRR